MVRARLLWTLLLLAAVFSMHGLSCVAAGTEGTGLAVSAAVGAGGGAPEAAAGLVLTSAHGVPTGNASTGPGTGTPDGHGPAAHALGVCLAVLAGGVGVALAAMAAWLARRRAVAVHPRATGRARVVVDRALACTPAPDLGRLCVLRV